MQRKQTINTERPAEEWQAKTAKTDLKETESLSSPYPSSSQPRIDGIIVEEGNTQTPVRVYFCVLSLRLR